MKRIMLIFIMLIFAIQSNEISYALRPMAVQKENNNTELLLSIVTSDPAAVDAWCRVFLQNTLAEVKNMDVLEFAKTVKAKEISDTRLFEQTGSPFFAINNDSWQRIKSARAAGDKVFPGNDALAIKCLEIDGPGVYFSTRANTPKWSFTKTGIFHEVLEIEYGNKHLVDSPFFRVLGHAQIGVLLNELIFAKLLGGEEFDQALAHISSNLQYCRESLKLIKENTREKGEVELIGMSLNLMFISSQDLEQMIRYLRTIMSVAQKGSFLTVSSEILRHVILSIRRQEDLEPNSDKRGVHSISEEKIQLILESSA